MQAVDDALAVFKRQINGRIHVRTYGVVVVVLLRVKLVGEPRHTHAQLEGQSAALAWRDGEVDERVEGKHLAQLSGDAVVAKAGILEGEADGRIVVKHFPAVLAVGVAMERELVTRGVAAVTTQG